MSHGLRPSDTVQSSTTILPPFLVENHIDPKVILGLAYNDCMGHVYLRDYDEISAETYDQTLFEMQKA